MAVPCLAMTFDDRAIHQVRQLREDYGFNTQHTWPRRNQLAIPQYNSQMTVDTIETPPMGNHGESTWKASCDLAPQLSKITAYLRSCVLQRPRLSCVADCGISSIEKTNTIGLVSTSPQTSSSAIAPKRGASELSSSARARPYVHQSRPSKRLQGSDDDSDRDDEEPKASTSKRARSKSTQHQFACPFWKLDPHKQRSCYSATLSEIRYVKQHILRRHVQPTHCTICMETFDSLKDLDRHLMQRSCATSSDPAYEGINEDQRHELQDWSARRGSSKVDQWFELWDMIFPGIPRPNSPFIDEEVFGKSHPEYVPEQLNALTVHGAPEMSLNPRRINTGLPPLGTDGHKIANKELRFACPYYKMFPQMVRSRKCAGLGWPTVHRVKQHIFRSHTAPLKTCPRCHTPCKSVADTIEHLEAKQKCIPREAPSQIATCSEDQVQQLKRRYTGTSNEADKWKEMYLILFPGAEEIPSPYHEQSESYGDGNDYAVEKYAEYLDNELPRRLRSVLDNSEPGLLNDRTTSQIVDIVRVAQRSLFQQYTSSDWPKVSAGSNKIESSSHTPIERLKSPGITFDTETEPDVPDFSITLPHEGLFTSYPTSSTNLIDEVPFEDMDLMFALSDKWAAYLPSDEVPMGGLNTANNLSSDLQTSSGDLQTPSLIPLGCVDDEVSNLGYMWNPPEKAGHTGIELESHREGISNSAESDTLEAKDGVTATEQ